MDVCREEYLRYAKMVCEDKTLYDFAISFYDDYTRLFRERLFYKKDFSTLNFEGLVIEQDIVKDLFKEREYVSAGEFLLYILKYNVRRIQYSTNMGDKQLNLIFSAVYNCHDKKILINKGKLNSLAPINKQDNSDIAMQISSGNDKKDSFYHEFCHACETFNFGFGEVCKVSSFQPFSNQISNEVREGLDLLGEIYNEVLAEKLLQCFHKVDTIIDPEEDDVFLPKKQINSNCDYITEYDIFYLLNQINPYDFTIRMNDKATFSHINSGKPDKTVLNAAIDGQIKILKSLKCNKKSIIKQLEKCKTRDMVNYLGVNLYIREHIDSCIWQEFKVYLQAVLINSYTNSINNITDFNDEKLISLDKVLNEINDFLLYPVFNYKFVEGKVCDISSRTNIETMHFKEFNKLITKIEEAIEDKSIIENMPFLNSQLAICKGYCIEDKSNQGYENKKVVKFKEVSYEI